MSTETIRLNPIVSRRQPPFRMIHRILTGADTLNIIAGDNLKVPNVWTLQSAIWIYIADATVASRYPNLNQFVDGELCGKIKGGAIAASETKYQAATPEGTYSNMSGFGSGYATIRDWTHLISGDDYWNLYTTAGVAGDSLEVWLIARYRNWDLGMLQPKIQRQKESNK